MSIFISVLLFLFLLPGVLKAESTIVKGKAVNAAGKVVRLTTIDDYISFKRVFLDEKIINEDGSFTLSASIEQTTYARIEIDFQYADIYLDPDHSYEIKVVYDPGKPTFTFGNNLKLEIQFTGGTGGLNFLIMDINTSYNRFMHENIGSSYGRIDKQAVSGFINVLDSIYENASHDYFKNYLKYRIASLELLARLKSKKSLAETYLMDNTPLYNNIEFMDFFNQYFSQFLITSGNIEILELYDVVNIKDDYTELDKILQNYSFLENKQLRELVLLKSLSEFYHTTGFNRTKITDFLSILASESNYAKHRKIAQNLIYTLGRFSRGSIAPDVELKNIDGEIRYLSSYSEKPIYLVISKSNNLSSIAEMDILKEVYPAFHDRITFLCISLDTDFTEIQNIKKERDYEWEFLIAADKPGFLNDYAIQSLPMFIMLDEQFRIYQYRAPAPSEKLERFFNQFLNQ